MTAGLGHNGMSRDEWLFAILRSGQVTRIAQHLALVIYHISDPTTNTAKVSARDLEEITGWGRTTIRQHVDELEIFVRVTWGAGRAKALFELQGVITEAIKPLRIERVVADQAAITHGGNGQLSGHNYIAVHGNGQLGGHNGSEVVANQVATTLCGEPDGHNSGHLNSGHAATTEKGQPDGHNATRKWSAKRPQIANGGDYRGGILESESSHHHHQGFRARVVENEGQPASAIFHPDGSFSGTAIESFTATEIASMRSVYPSLDLIPELINADKFLAGEFERDGTPFGSQDRYARLHQFLLKKNRDAFALIQAAQAAAKEKATRAQSDSCWFTEEGRLMVANGFKAELVEIVGGDEAKLRRVLDKAAGTVPIDLRGASLLKNVRSAVVKNADWTAQDERKVRAVERRGQPASTIVDGVEKVETTAQRLERMAMAMDNGGRS